MNQKAASSGCYLCGAKSPGGPAGYGWVNLDPPVCVSCVATWLKAVLNREPDSGWRSIVEGRSTLSGPQNLGSPPPSPPYESPIEERFAREIAARFHDGVACEPQRILPEHRVRLDFVAEYAGRRINIECDGRDFHDYVRDRRRDLRLLRLGVVSDVIRLRGRDINFAINEVLTFLDHLMPEFFNPGLLRPDTKTLMEFETILPLLRIKPIFRTTIPVAERRRTAVSEFLDVYHTARLDAAEGGAS